MRIRTASPDWTGLIRQSAPVLLSELYMSYKKRIGNLIQS